MGLRRRNRRAVLRWAIQLVVPVGLLWLVGPPLAAAEEDAVTVASHRGQSQTTYYGQIVDYTGRELQLRTAGGSTRTFPGQDVIRVQTRYGRSHVAADEAFAEGRFEQAEKLYRQAGSEDPRRWVRRQIMSQIVWCHQALGHPEQAGEWFLLLIADDPETQYFDCIPLAWTSEPPSLAVEQAAREWISQTQPAAVLLGASYLLNGDARVRAMAAGRLRGLLTVSDQRVAVLARAQTWRLAAGSQQQPELWKEAIAQMPRQLTPGPYFLLARAYMQQQQWEPAALAALRVSLLWPRHRALAAQCLLDAGQCLQRLGRSAEAMRLYEELNASYPDSLAAAEAQDRIQQLIQ